MDPHQPQKCKWIGGCPNNTILGGPHCQDHRRQYYESRHPQPNKNDSFRSSSSIPSIPKDSAATRLVNGSTENGLLNSPYSSRVSSPKLDKKQLQENFTARKSVKSSLSSGQPQVSPVPPIHMLPSDLPSANPRPVKRQRVSGVPNLSEPRPKSNSSFSENGIPPLSKRGMLRQSEERTYKLSAIDDFALRPKKKDAVIESARSNAYNDQRQPSRGDIRPSSSGRQPAPASNQQPQSTGLDGVAHPVSPVIIADDSGSTLSRPKPQPQPQPQPQPPPRSSIPNGIPGVGRLIPKPSPDGQTELPREKGNVVTPNSKQGREGPIQPGGVAQVKHGPSASVEQALKNLHAQKAPQSTIPSPPTVQATSRPRQLNGLSPKPPGNKQRVTGSTQKNGLGPVHVDSSNTSTHPQLPPTKQHQPVNGIHQASVEEGNSIPIKGWTPINLVRKDSKPEQSTIKRVAKTKQITPAPEAINPVPQEIRVVPADQNYNIQSPVPSVQNMQSTPVTTPVTVTETSQPPSTSSQGPLSGLLGGREWKKMSPEERRLFWVAQHDADAFDAQIYSENNRPFRPGDELFGLPEDELPPRPKRAATHFDYIDPRPTVPVYRFEEWYEKKQDEIKSRGNRKANFGKAVKRLAQQKREAFNLSQKKHTAVPQRVQDNPKWLAALDVLKQIEAQNRAKKRRTRLAKDKWTPASANDYFFACRHGIKQLAIDD
ncbi:hypothetical protein RRF57_010416 [Xylaria bambusicola]|uniref:Uncharacterized protein n=1 Tax=Xylaria bambusicola TaxID=326684 RepID=A0AAN7ZCZ6_9PEZI